MSYTALYNKYRPKTFEQVAGQQAIVRTLRNAINNGKTAHAYLFCGPRGTGKTSMARLFAKALNCEQGVGHQCNECENCRQLNEGAHPDVIEIDAASNNGVDQVRELIEQVRYSPIKGRVKVYIIDEVHMMSAGAFNALLKTLEEPPEHVLFILATTEPHKVLPTILSRCQRYDFAKISHKDIKEKLVWILGQEGIHYEETALDEIIDLADGGMRDALSLLDQALAYGGNELLEKDVLSVFGLTSTKEKLSLLEMVCSGEVGNVLNKLNSFMDAGLDIKRLSSSLLDILKDELIFRRLGDVQYAKVLKKEEAEELSAYIDSKRANEMIDLLVKAQIDFKSVSNIRSLFELTLLQMTTLFGPDKADAIVTPIKAVVKETPVKKEETPVVEIKEEVELTPAKPAPKAETPRPAPKAYDPFRDGAYTGSSAPSFLLEDDGSKPKEPIPEIKPEPKPEPKVVEPEPEPVVEEARPQEQPAPEPVPEPESKKEEPKPVVKPTPVVPSIDTSKLQHTKIVTEGNLTELSDDTCIQIMVLGGKFKGERQTLKTKWASFESLSYDILCGEAATLLSKGSPFCLCGEALLINYAFPNQAERTNFRENQKTLSEMVSLVLGRKVFVYGLDRNASNRLQKAYFSKAQLGLLPNVDSIVLELPKE